MQQQTKGVINADSSVADLIISHPQLLTPLMRMGIRPALGNTTLRQVSQNSSLGLELSTQLLELSINPGYEPTTLTRYSLLPLTDFYCKSMADLKPWLGIMNQHLMRMGGSRNESALKPVLVLFGKFSQQLAKTIDSQEDVLKSTIQHLYELFYSPAIEECDQEIIKKALELTSKKSDETSASVLEDIISLLLRHTKVGENDMSFYGAIQQLCNLRSSIEYIGCIRAKLLHPMVTDMAHTIRRRQKM